MNRRDFLKISSLGTAGAMMTLHDLDKWLGGPASPKLPALFLGHGSPMNALEDNPFTRTMRQVGANLLKECPPRAILVVSAHWLTRGTFVSTANPPETIHDFGGFPQELFDMQYPAPGAPNVAAEVKELLPAAGLTSDWGLDHGAWSLLVHLFPKADIPVFQMSIDYYQPMPKHFELASQLRKLRERGVLIIGSGNIVHNLQRSMVKFSQGDPTPYDWAVEFDAWVGKQLEARNNNALFDYASAGKAGQLSVPTPDHYIPMLYTLGLGESDEPITQLYEEVTYGGISMRSFSVG